MEKPLITLTTDFGLKDPYTAAMKGVILSICRNADIVDLSHNIEPYSIFNCAKYLSESIPYFPESSVHVIVVDPGVGSQRKPVAVFMHNRYFVCPDNGVLTMLIDRYKNYRAFEITNRKYCMPEISNTFHGRDIFAPAAAHLASGLNIKKLGSELTELFILNIKNPVAGNNGTVTGEIVYIDNFGNCISNICKSMTGKIIKIEINNTVITRIAENYSKLEKGIPGVLAGSSGYLEVVFNMESAHDLLNIKKGDKLVIYTSG
jgi:S-adenosyl-L-methionine hydrolase (adenosine-forming)